MTDKFSQSEVGLNSVITSLEDIDISSTDHVLSQPSRALYVGGTGAVKLTLLKSTQTTFEVVSAGTILPLRVKKVFKTGTDASNIIALW